jgi:hypothetical protein
VIGKRQCTPAILTRHARTGSHALTRPGRPCTNLPATSRVSRDTARRPARKATARARRDQPWPAHPGYPQAPWLNPGRASPRGGRIQVPCLQAGTGEINDIRLETARKIAAALGVPTSGLMPRGDAPVPAPESLVAWQPVRHALDGAPDAELPGEPTLEGVRSTFRGVLPLLLGSRFAELGVVLPALLRDADALVAGSVNGTRASARALRAQIRQVAGALMLHTWQFETADKAFDLAMSDADDPLIAMSVVEERC